MKIFGSINEQYTNLWKAIIRPPRDAYDPEDIGPSRFQTNGIVVTRRDVDLKNRRGHLIRCSHFEPEIRASPELPCVIYLHGNCSSRLEALQCVPTLLPSQISLFALDFSGSGLSDGEYVSLGYHERDDLAVVVDYLRGIGTVSLIGLWGRSMGAATALMHVDRDPSIAAMVLDSPFADLRRLADELVGEFLPMRLPKFLVGWGLSFIRSSIKSRADFDILHLSPIAHVSACFVPALFVAAEDDTFVRPKHSRDLHDAYAGDKRIVLVPGSHNSARPQSFVDSAAVFFYNALQCSKLPIVNHIAIDSSVPRLLGRNRSIRGMGVGGSQTEDENHAIQRAIEASLVSNLQG